MCQLGNIASWHSHFTCLEASCIPWHCGVVPCMFGLWLFEGSHSRLVDWSYWINCCMGYNIGHRGSWVQYLLRAKVLRQHRGAWLWSTWEEYFSDMKVRTSIADNLTRWVACIHSSLLKEFGSIEVSNGKHEDTWEVIWLDFCAFVLIVWLRLRRASFSMWHPEALHGCLSYINTHHMTIYLFFDLNS